MNARPPGRVAVVGGGILGASIAYHLARRGADVVVVEKTRPAAEATGRSFGWINASFGNPRPYFSLRLQSMLEYRELERTLDGELRVKWSGSLLWLGDPADRHLDELERKHQSWGYPVRLVERAEIGRIEARVDPAPAAAAHAEWEGSVDPVRATEALLEGARQLGARIEYPCAVTALHLGDAGVRGLATTRGEVAADVVVLAAGTSTPALARQAGVRVPLVDSPSVLVHTKPTAPLLGPLVLAPDCHLKQELDGRVVAGPGLSERTSTDASPQAGERILATARRLVPRLEGVEIDRVAVGWRPMPGDERPIVGFCAPRLYVAVTHSGITLAPILGRLAAREILDGVSVDLLEPYRPSRFA